MVKKIQTMGEPIEGVGEAKTNVDIREISPINLIQKLDATSARLGGKETLRRVRSGSRNKSPNM